MTALWRTLRLVSVSCKIKQISTLMFEQWDWSRGAGEAVVIVRTLGLFLPAPTPALIHANQWPVTRPGQAGGSLYKFSRNPWSRVLGVECPQIRAQQPPEPRRELGRIPQYLDSFAALKYPQQYSWILLYLILSSLLSTHPLILCCVM